MGDSSKLQVGDWVVAIGNALALPGGPTVQLGVKLKDGAVVLQVNAGGPAAQAGLQQGDVITKVDNQPAVGDSGLPQLIQTHKPGDKVSLNILSNNKQSNVQVTRGEMPPPQTGG
jgi:S1-C subfamily serine protease